MNEWLFNMGGSVSSEGCSLTLSVIRTKGNYNSGYTRQREAKTNIEVTKNRTVMSRYEGRALIE